MDKIDKELYTGMVEIELSDEELSKFYETGQIDGYEFLNNQYLLLKREGKVIDKYRWFDGKWHKLNIKPAKNNILGKIFSLNDYQDCMVDMLLDKKLTVKSILGIPGGGKSFLALVYGITKVLNGEFNKLVYTKNNLDIGFERIGAIPGSVEEKLEPWSKVLLDVFVDDYLIDKLKNEGKLEVDYLGHTVGRTYNNTFFVVDDGQQLSKRHVYNLTTRLGHNSVICFCSDLYQTYSKKYENEKSGIRFLHNQLKGQDCFAGVHTKKSERSRTAQICANLLFDAMND